MAGWLVVFGIRQGFENRRVRFENIFSVQGVPDVRIECVTISPEFTFLGWAWNKQEIPDVYLCRRGPRTLVLGGVVTGLGRYSCPEGTQQKTAIRILDLWIQYGEKIIPELNGSFSILLYDGETRHLQVFTDRYASRPVCFLKHEDGLIIGDSPAAVAAIIGGWVEVDPASVWSLLHLGRRLGRHTLFAGMKHLLAGERLVFSVPGVEMVSTWRERRYTPEEGIAPREWGERIAAALKASASRYRNVCQHPRLFLSGGLDSRLAAAAFDNGLETITLCPSPNAESRFAGRVARFLRHSHQVMERSPWWYLETADASSLISAGDHLDQHAHFIVPVRELEAAGPKAEYFLGDLLENLNKHYFSIPRGLKYSFDAEFLRDKLPLCVPYTMKNPERLGVHLVPEFCKQAEEAYDEALKEIVDSIKPVSENNADRMDTLLRWSDVAVTYTYNMLTCIRSLAPERNLCFDNDLDDLSVRIPVGLRGAGILHRWTLWHLHPALAIIPEANTFLPPMFPRYMGEATKKLRPILGRVRRAMIRKGSCDPVLATSGSWLLKHEMYRKDERYRHWIEGLLDDPAAFPAGIFEKKQISRTWNAYLKGDLVLHFELEALLSFGNLWRQLNKELWPDQRKYPNNNSNRRL